MTNKTDSNGFYISDRQADVTLHMRGGVKMQGDAGSIISELSIRRFQPDGASRAWRTSPDQRLRTRDDGQLTGNIIVDAEGAQHELDTHDPATFAKRTPNYIVGTNCISLVDPAEIALGREQTLEVLREIFKKNGGSPFEIVGHYGSTLTESQLNKLRDWLLSLKKVTKAA